MRIIRAEFLGMCFGVRDAIALAAKHAEAGPLTILGDLVHNPAVLGRLRDKGIAVAHESRRGTDADRDGHRAWHIGTRAGSHAGSRSDGCRSHLSARARRTPRRPRARQRRLSPGHHRPAQPRRGSRADRRSGRVRRRPGRRRRRRARAAPADRRRRPDDAVDRQSPIPGRAHSAAVPAGRRPLHRHGLPADQGPAESRPRSGAPVRRRHRRRRRQQQQHPRAHRGVPPVMRQRPSRPGRVGHPSRVVLGRRHVGITAGTSTPDDVIDQVELRIRELSASSQESPAPCAVEVTR